MNDYNYIFEKLSKKQHLFFCQTKNIQKHKNLIINNLQNKHFILRIKKEAYLSRKKCIFNKKNQTIFKPFEKKRQNSSSKK